MDQKITLLHPRWVICVDNDNRVLQDHSVIIKEDLIADIRPRQTALQTYPNSESIELPQQALMPGLVNAHTHLAMNLLRGFADDLPLMTWLNDHIWPAESAHIDYRFVEDGSRLAVAELLQGGVTCFNDMYFFPEAVAAVAAETGIRATVGMIVIDFPSAWANNADEYLQKGIDLHQQLQSSALISTILAPHAPYTVCDDTLNKVVALRDKLGVGVHMHIHETTAEVTQYQQEHGVRPIEKLEQLNLLNEKLCAVHMTQVTDKEIELLARRQCHMLHCPESNLKLASGMAPVTAMANAGINIAIGTDGAASNNDLDMLGETRTAGFIGKIESNNAAALPTTQPLRMATLNGAKALGMDQITGSIEKGKQADLISIDFDSICMQPVYDPVSQIVYSASRHDVSNTWVAGERLLKDKQLTRMNTADLISNATEWSHRITSTTS